MYQLEKYFEEVVDENIIGQRIDSAKDELLLNMMDYSGKVIVTTLIGSGAGQHAGKEFLELVKVDEEIISEAEEDCIHDLAEEYFTKLSEDLTTMCENNNIDIGEFSLYVGYNDNDGAIELYLSYDDYDSIEHLSEEEYQLHKALAEDFDCYLSEIVDNGDGEFQIGGKEYLVLTEDEANEKAQDYIKDSLWAFNPSFLASETGLPIEMFEALANNDKCESNNDALLTTIEATCGIDSFIESAIGADGRGHFINSYDGNEIELDSNGETYYIYRQG